MAAIELEGLTKDYGEVLANDGVTFDVELGRSSATSARTAREDDDDPDPAGVHFADRRFGAAAGRDITDEGTSSRPSGDSATSPTARHSTRRRRGAKYSTCTRRSRATSAAGSYLSCSSRRLTGWYGSTRGTSRNWGS